MGISVLLESPEVRSAGSKDPVGVKGLDLECVEPEMRRRPTAAGETTVEPFFGTVRGIGAGIAVAAGAGELDYCLECSDPQLTRR